MFLDFTQILYKNYIISNYIKTTKDKNMTTEEEQEFKQKIAETIMPIAINMTEDQIRSIVQTVENDNPQLPSGFADMLFQQIMVAKYNHAHSN